MTRRVGPRRALALVAAALVLGGVAPAAASACANATLVPNGTNLAQIRAAVVCLINAERARAGLPPLAVNTALGNAAQGHAEEMAARHFFAHGNVLARIRASGYLAGASRYGYGENIAYNCGAAATAAGIVDQWMPRGNHRANILSRSFQDIGIGVVLWSPNGCAGASYVANFGFN